MLKRVVSLVAAALFFALVVFASDPWKDKDFSTWDQKDVQRILKDSPWSKQFQYGFDSGGAMSKPFSATGEAANAASMGGGGGNSGASGASTGPEMVFTVSWISSRTVREARARARELQGTSPEEARKDLSAQQDTYMIAVLGTNLGLFGKENTDSLKAHSYLMSKNTKEKLSPSRVVIQPGKDPRHPVAVIYEFAKKTDAGAPTIAAGEKGLEFGTAAGNTPIKVSFDVSKMVDKQGPDM